MSYQALYRVWRPQSFDELVGQDMIAHTLRNAIQYKQLSHAYLFAGPRGTGKTSAAKILAKAVNCPYADDGNPCNECEICRGITAGEISDVIEIDAASNNGVDEIRDLRDKVRYAPTLASNKVYIIDEVHMLTTGAFNALLKTLEEPPEHVVFILATTEPHKIPATILSRTQRFDFQRISDQNLINRMKYILEHDQIAYSSEALAILARAANGGMRDSLSLLDQSLSLNNQEVSVEVALQVSGSFAQQVYVEYILALYQENVAEALDLLEQQLMQGKQAHRFIEELILFARDVLLSLFSSENLTLLTDQEIQPLRETVPPEFYYQLIEGLNQAQGQMRLSVQPEVYLEVMTVQLAQGKIFNGQAKQTDMGSELSEVPDKIRELEEQIAALNQRVEGQKKLIDDLMQRFDEAKSTKEQLTITGKQNPEPKVLNPREKPIFAQKEYLIDLHDIYHVLNRATREHLRKLREAWPSILADLTPQQRVKLKETSPIAAGENCALISFEGQEFCALVQHDSLLVKQLNNIASKYLNENSQLCFVATEDWPGIRRNYKILFDQNGGKPVDLPAKLSQSGESDLENKNPIANQEDENHKFDHIKSEEDQFSNADNDFQQEVAVENKEQLSQSTVEIDGETESTASLLFKRSQEQFSSEEQEPSEFTPVEGQTNFFDVEVEEDGSEVQSVSPVVQKAIELFGSENINIYEK
ncbi:DNA polymerase III subunit gamma/tau [Facklamia sp. DSM 111018]|uniref:DNA-directed DNA polymerase n=1 Tax=Facklamia lactis TaxID=2749967 RepID=A0ABS0LT06_9LACT|nr:DNA polymerase III subunit gamma/tau [Facklamia lactis]MBG9981380.1 DNA polymerase III subunit gamma/tau [Facklamia lactis]MBG9987144.1 DNA polymerase III subunit gamma/tau [Facklamia lactis]